MKVGRYAIGLPQVHLHSHGRAGPSGTPEVTGGDENDAFDFSDIESDRRNANELD